VNRSYQRDFVKRQEITRNNYLKLMENSYLPKAQKEKNPKEKLGAAIRGCMSPEKKNKNGKSECKRRLLRRA